MCGEGNYVSIGDVRVDENGGCVDGSVVKFFVERGPCEVLDGSYNREGGAIRVKALCLHLGELFHKEVEDVVWYDIREM